MKISTKDLYLKYQRSGLDGNPAITDAELKELEERLKDIGDLFFVWNPLILPINMLRSSVQNVIFNREEL